MKSSTKQMITVALAADETIDSTSRKQLAQALAGKQRAGKQIGTKEAAAILGIHPISLRRLEKRGAISAVRLSKRRIRWFLEDVTRLRDQGVEIDRGVEK
ncbi:hypothetical protein PDESU_01945 [Pontiella desulfatans]|uniref:Helix-turn-helix domain-containing protein n=1 Tax=Pontiella desulfatans TaxID=2750659 RepID=A0A6C2U0A0_PONDE|nr:hypothetical protein [Pontiella desulfatans]VGO13388.1 hypothetical protein PDESU_01945 [Pontiella desulfatans]